MIMDPDSSCNDHQAFLNYTYKSYTVDMLPFCCYQKLSGPTKYNMFRWQLRQKIHGTRVRIQSCFTHNSNDHCYRLDYDRHYKDYDTETTSDSNNDVIRRISGPTSTSSVTSAVPLPRKKENMLPKWGDYYYSWVSNFLLCEGKKGGFCVRHAFGTAKWRWHICYYVFQTPLDFFPRDSQHLCSHQTCQFI